MLSSISDKSEYVRSLAHELGFDRAGISRAEKLHEESDKLSDWLKKRRQGEMDYMNNHFELRTDPSQLVVASKSVISLAFNYFTDTKQSDPDAPVVSIYAFGKDYHRVLKKKLKIFIEKLRMNIGVDEGRCFVDSAPVLERALAQRSGLGWIGKNTMLIHPKKGSYFFLAELIIDVELEYDEAMKDHCGRCRKCIEACPTGAIDINGYSLDARKCISYVTIEKKGPIPSSFDGKMENRVFGCDICIEVCPWNKFAKEHSEMAFEPKSEMLQLSRSEWDNMSEEEYEKLFNGTALRRPKYKGLKRNIDFLKLNDDSNLI